MRRLILLILLIVTQVAHGQMIEFDSDYEKKVLSSFDKDRSESLALLFAIKSEEFDEDKLTNRRSELDAFVKELKKSGFLDKPKKKKAKILFREVHDRFFRVYNESAYFDQIFSQGIYNCVTGTALYAEVCERLEIPYHIKEAPSHVYLVLYPNQESILLETTLPGGGFLAPSDKIKQEYVNGLVELKFVEASEVSRKGVNVVFEENYYEKSNVDLFTLGAFQYYNYAIEELGNKEYEKAFNAIEKALIIKKTDRFEYLQAVLLTNLIQDLKFESERDFILMSHFARIRNDEASKNYVLFNYQSFLEKNLIDNAEEQRVEEVYKYFVNELDSGELKEKVVKSTLYTFARYHFHTANYDKALIYADSLLGVNPKNVNAKSIIISCVRSKIEGKSGKRLNDLILDYLEEYSFLNENDQIISLRLNNLAYMTGTYFHSNEGVKGSKSLEELEELLKKDIDFQEKWVGMAFAEAGAYYYRKGKLNVAKSILKKGMKYCEDFPELKERLNIVNEVL
ncbi:hypothetical protein [Aureibacter tunicatorum]|uniref:Tetratricopeptide (TPR) repeat protein n=1 Tax=Aureibacter tunicatorum TaxID=866807 RepID=A0AAE3XLQ8_9BACT|nr:hypothetical protein [Aureibacter tunicatorum]MDR6238260.1 tetratricopeptide (TPR) repeat protein [Aureibacter tunicatorum]BDD03293.1 hypothetical protein AUTU_07760 [Aureibacter tunicatorum]